mgnify:CR=1 FL=1
MKNLFRLGFRFAAFATVLMAAFSTSAFAQDAAAAGPQSRARETKARITRRNIGPPNQVFYDSGPPLYASWGTLRHSTPAVVTENGNKL